MQDKLVIWDNDRVKSHPNNAQTTRKQSCQVQAQDLRIQECGVIEDTDVCKVVFLRSFRGCHYRALLDKTAYGDAAKICGCIRSLKDIKVLKCTLRSTPPSPDSSADGLECEQYPTWMWDWEWTPGCVALEWLIFINVASTLRSHKCGYQTQTDELGSVQYNYQVWRQQRNKQVISERQ
ncbi:hypothetical protein M405DRAFT_846556 [Rhizopogon salebrosus TDB-379]|nr:hypothetical protein M405DRAFT_846556 [Rhizopogon salebrosus TDB-379]